MKFCLRILKNIDFTRVNYFFSINGKENFRTVLGGISHLFLIIAVIYFIIDSSQDFFNRKLYQSMTHTFSLTSPPSIDLKDFKLKFLFYMNYDNKSTIPKNIFDQYLREELYFVKMLNGKNKTREKINLKKCERDDLLNDYNTEDEFFIKEYYKNYNCLEKTNFTLTGAFTDEIFQYIEYGVYLKWPNFTGDKIEPFQKYVTDNLISVSFKYFELSLNMDNFTYPIRSYENNVFDYLNFNIIKKKNLDFSQYKFQSDSDFIFNNPNEDNFAKLNTIQDYFTMLNDRNTSRNDYNLLFKFYIRSCSQTYVLKRIYQKLSGLLI